MATTQALPAVEPPPSRVIVLIDGANLFNSIKRRFAYQQPNADIAKLAKAVVHLKANRKIERIYYYIGVPAIEHDRKKHEWWNRKITGMGRQGVTTIRRALKPRELNIDITGVVHHKSTNVKLIEKGIDLRLGLDLVKHTANRSFDVAVIFSQDGDLAEAVQDAFQIAEVQKRRIVIECAYPVNGLEKQYGINKATPVEFDRALYDTCLDPTDYNRP
jgi:uncharacterized LabA/DUF88 family protein